MTISQISRLFYTNKDYCYKRLQKLRHAGYLIAQPHVERETGKKLATCYYLTQAGYNAIGETHYNPTAIIEPYKHDYLVGLSELYTQATPPGWEWTNSRNVKARFGLNRGNRIAALIARTNPNSFNEKDEYGIYLLGANPRPSLMTLIQAELKENQTNINSAFILHHSSKEYLQCEKDNKITPWTDHLEMYNLHILHYDLGTELIKLMVNPDYILQSPFKEAWEVIGAKYQERKPELFSDHLVHYQGVYCHLTELVSNNLTTIYHLRNFNLNKAREVDRRVIILTPPDKIDYWRNEFKEEHYPHFRFFPVNGLDEI